MYPMGNSRLEIATKVKCKLELETQYLSRSELADNISEDSLRSTDCARSLLIHFELEILESTAKDKVHEGVFLGQMRFLAFFNSTRSRKMKKVGQKKGCRDSYL